MYEQAGLHSVESETELLTLWLKELRLRNGMNWLYLILIAQLKIYSVDISKAWVRY